MRMGRCREKTSMEAVRELLPGNYIVRIYRRGKDDKRMVVGIVEEVGVREKPVLKGLRDIFRNPLIFMVPKRGVARISLRDHAITP
ncbi:MAG: hypothetical protein HW377_527 [Actinobacteria bacterium]|nr:hypothetical protein [Actinomycetota bacterium]